MRGLGYGQIFFKDLSIYMRIISPKNFALITDSLNRLIQVFCPAQHVSCYIRHSKHTALLYVKGGTYAYTHHTTQAHKQREGQFSSTSSNIHIPGQCEWHCEGKPAPSKMIMMMMIIMKDQKIFIACKMNSESTVKFMCT